MHRGCHLAALHVAAALSGVGRCGFRSCDWTLNAACSMLHACCPLQLRTELYRQWRAAGISASLRSSTPRHLTYRHWHQRLANAH